MSMEKGEVGYGQQRDEIAYRQHQDDIEYRRQVVNTYKPDVERLIRYLPWLEEKAGHNVAETFEGSGIKGSSITFPVYDSTLMSLSKNCSGQRFWTAITRISIQDTEYGRCRTKLR